MSSGARVVTHCIPEVTPGTTPTTGTWQTMRLTSNTLSPTPTTVESDEIAESRISQGTIVTGVTNAGDLVGELTYGTFDAWLEAAFYGAWAANVLSVGSVRKSFSVQKGYTDAGTYHLFKGCHVATAALEIPEEGKITLTLGIQAMGYTDRETTYVTGTPTAPNDAPFMSSISVGDIKADGVSLAGSACISAMRVNIDNNIQAQKCLGSGQLGPSALLATDATIGGTLTMAWGARAYAIWKEQISRKTFAIEFPITDSLGNEYTLSFPAVEVTGPLPSAGKREIVQVELAWNAVKSSPTITRVPAPDED